jgi:hypothetical protein
MHAQCVRMVMVITRISNLQVVRRYACSMRAYGNGHHMNKQLTSTYLLSARWWLGMHAQCVHGQHVWLGNGHHTNKQLTSTCLLSAARWWLGMHAQCVRMVCVR